MLDRVPLLPYFIAFSAGIAAAFHLPSVSFSWKWGVPLLFLGWAAWGGGWRRGMGALLVVTAFGIGGLRYRTIESGRPGAGEPWFGIPEGTHLYQGVVSSYPQRTPFGHTFRCRLDSWEGKSWLPLRATAQLSMAGERMPRRGDTIRFRARLRTPRNFGNAREFDFERYAATRGIDLVGSIGSERNWVLEEPADNFFRTRLNRIRENAVGRAEMFLSPLHFSLWKSLVLGDRIDLAPEEIDAFRAAGVIHLLVVSGFHVTLMALLFGMLASFLIRRSASLVSLVPVVAVKGGVGLSGAFLFCLLTDLPLPTLRALIVVALIAGALWAERPADGLALWVVSAFALLAIQPLFLFDLSAQLSFLAVLGILLAFEAFPPGDEGRARGKVVRWAKGVLLGTCGATLATLPALLHALSRLTLWTIPGNYLLVPTLGSVATPLGFAAGFLPGAVGGVLFSLFDLWLGLILPVVRFFRVLPASDLWIPQPPAMAMTAYAGLLLAIAFRKGFTKSWLRNGAIVALSAGVVFPFSVPGRYKGSSVHVLHVGEGDATVVRSKEGRSILIDAGGGGRHSMDAGERIIIPWLRVAGIDRIDLLAITHGDSDHAGGAWSILERVEVGELWLPREGGEMTEPLRKEADRRGIPWRRVDAGSPPMEWQGLRISVLYPPAEERSPGRGSNDRSMVLMVDQGGYRTLLTGDVEAASERNLLDRGADLRADLLKVPHHGSKSSTTSRFLERVSPRDAVITSGWKNRFGHPSADVVARLLGRGVRIWRGDFCGEFVTQVSGDEIRSGPVHPCRNPLQ